MRILACVILLIAAGVAPAAAQAQAVLVCTATGGLVGAPSYRIEIEGSEASLYRVPAAPAARPVRLASSDQLTRFGSTTIFHANLGKSGYALVYSNQAAGRSMAVIDINLPTRRDLGTEGPVTTYACARPSPVPHP